MGFNLILLFLISYIKSARLDTILARTCGNEGGLIKSGGGGGGGGKFKRVVLRTAYMYCFYYYYTYFIFACKLRSWVC